MTTEPLIRRLLDTKAAAKYIGMSAAFFRLSRYKGVTGNRTPGPPYIRIGRRALYDLCDLDAWINSFKKITPKVY
jgi:hypothetical protein